MFTISEWIETESLMLWIYPALPTLVAVLMAVSLAFRWRHLRNKVAAHAHYAALDDEALASSRRRKAMFLVLFVNGILQSGLALSITLLSYLRSLPPYNLYAGLLWTGAWVSHLSDMRSFW